MTAGRAEDGPPGLSARSAALPAPRRSSGRGAAAGVGVRRGGVAAEGRLPLALGGCQLRVALVGEGDREGCLRPREVTVGGAGAPR